MIVIDKQPLSLLVPLDEVANFSCSATCGGQACCGHWIINNTQDRVQQEELGFSFHHESIGDRCIMNTSVLASVVGNNTRLRCYFMHCNDTHYSNVSHKAKLLVISGKQLNMFTLYAAKIYNK